MNTVENVLDRCTIEGNIVKLPAGELDRVIYVGVKKVLEGIGGKWKGGKTAGFVFPHDPTELLGRVNEGEDINLKKDFQCFPTPADIADRLVRMADINDFDVILEPSAGQGAIVDAIQRFIPGLHVNCYELMEQNREILMKNENISLHGHDFLEGDASQRYSKVIANPPFTKNQDIDHVYRMYDSLNPGGKLVSIMSQHWTMSDNKKETKFNDWFDNLGGHITWLAPNSFKESGTTIAPCIIEITKPGGTLSYTPE